MSTPGSATAKSSLEWLQIGVFAALLVAPGFARWSRVGEGRSAAVELRRPARKPVLRLGSLGSYPQRFEAYAADRFGLRGALLRGRSMIVWFALGRSPTEACVRGEGDWIFFTESKSIEILRGTDPFTAGELDAWTRTLERRRDWLASRGSAYVFAIIPNKNQVYPEHLPSRLGPPGRTRLDQLREHLAERSDFRLLDLREPLLAAKRDDRPEQDDWVYPRLGTHWSERGAFAGYGALIDRLREDVPALDRLGAEDFRLVLAENEGDTWAGRMYLDGLLHQRAYSWVFEGERRARYDARQLKRAGNLRTGHERGDLPTAIVFHDSFGPTLRPWLAESFSRVDFVWSNAFDAERVAAVRPDVVVQIRTERMLATTTPQLSSLEDPDGPRRAFEAGEALLPSLDLAAPVPGFAAVGTTVLSPRIGPEGPELAILTRSARDLVLLPEFEFPDGPAVLRLDLVSPRETTLHLYFRTPRGAPGEGGRSLRARVRAGANELYVHLPAVGMTGRLLLRPGREPGEYVLRRLEVRE